MVEGNTRGLAVCAGARADRVDDDGEVCVTAVTWGELRFGDRRPGEMPRDEDEDEDAARSVAAGAGTLGVGSTGYRDDGCALALAGDEL